MALNVLQPSLGSNPCVGFGVSLSSGLTLQYLGHSPNDMAANAVKVCPKSIGFVLF
jgi:hypothetical protein